MKCSFEKLPSFLGTLSLGEGRSSVLRNSAALNLKYVEKLVFFNCIYVPSKIRHCSVNALNDLLSKMFVKKTKDPSLFQNIYKTANGLL